MPDAMIERAPVASVSFPVVAGLVRLLDLLLLGLAGPVSVALTALIYGSAPAGPVGTAAVIGALATVVSIAREGGYSQAVLSSPACGVRLLLKPLALGVFCVIAALFLSFEARLPFRLWPLIWAAVAAAALVAGRVRVARLMQRWSVQGRLARKIAVVGANDFSREFIDRLEDEPNAFRVVGLYDDRGSRAPASQGGVPWLGTVNDLLEHSRLQPVDVIVVALPLSAVDRISRILEQLASTVADIVLTTDLAGLRFSRAQLDGIGRNPVVSVREAPLKDWRALKKTMLDYSVGLAALLALSPVLLVTALAIKLDSPGPVLFRQPRMGFNNRLFLCYKFRSMHTKMTDLLADRQTTKDDPRITRVGRFIRKFSIDELPQLLNVLNGTMSLVGPRPHAPNTKAADRLFSEVVGQYAVRHRVRPGITGWAQVNGWRGETTTVDQIEQRVACDLFYIENWSVRLDLKIMLMTILREVRSKNAF